MNLIQDVNIAYHISARTALQLFIYIVCIRIHWHTDELILCWSFGCKHRHGDGSITWTIVMNHMIVSSLILNVSSDVKLNKSMCERYSTWTNCGVYCPLNLAKLIALPSGLGHRLLADVIFYDSIFRFRGYIHCTMTPLLPITPLPCSSLMPSSRTVQAGSHGPA